MILSQKVDPGGLLKAPSAESDRRKITQQVDQKIPGGQDQGQGQDQAGDDPLGHHPHDGSPWRAITSGRVFDFALFEQKLGPR